MSSNRLLAMLLFLVIMITSNSLPSQAAAISNRSVKETGHSIAKRHSEGTFTSDYSKFMDNARAKEFVNWLMNSKRARWHEDTAMSEIGSKRLITREDKDLKSSGRDARWLLEKQHIPSVGTRHSRKVKNSRSRRQARPFLVNP
uniref:pro-glucagon-like n=1 Tax=Myxine glutinosa TaxID=7769 RepID=UPI00358E95C7